MPVNGAEGRATAMAGLGGLYRNLLLDKSFVALAEKATRQRNLNDYEKGTVRVINRGIRAFKKLPYEFVEKENRTYVKAEIAWRRAKERSDFRIFRPELEEVIKISQDKAELLGYDGHPYDALVDIHEENMKTAELDRIFARFIPRLKHVRDRVMSSGSEFTKESRLEHRKYAVDKMGRINDQILKILNYDRDSVRLDVSTHPSTFPLGPKDARITTRYGGVNFKNTLFSTIHEAGHALYDLNIDASLSMTPLGRVPRFLSQCASMGLHESQSRFWENFVGRGRSFVRAVMPILRNNLDFLKRYDEEQVYAYFNSVRPGSIRTGADEVTYDFHIALRYEIEKLLLTGELKAGDLPEFWNDKAEEFLGVRPKNEAEGALQDIQWTMGFGYFPTYTLGNIAAALVWHRAKRELKGLEKNIRDRRFKPLQGWLRQKIYRYGLTYPPAVLLKKKFGEGYNPDYAIKYLEEKYLQ